MHPSSTLGAEKYSLALAERLLRRFGADRTVDCVLAFDVLVQLNGRQVVLKIIDTFSDPVYLRDWLRPYILGQQALLQKTPSGAETLMKKDDAVPHQSTKSADQETKKDAEQKRKAFQKSPSFRKLTAADIQGIEAKGSKKGSMAKLKATSSSAGGGGANPKMDLVGVLFSATAGPLLVGLFIVNI